MSLLPRVVVATLPGIPDFRHVQAAHAAGHIGLLSIEHCDPQNAAVQTAFDSLAASDVTFAISIGDLSAAAEALIVSGVGRGLTQVLLTNAQDPKLQTQTTALKKLGLEVIVQVISLDEALSALRAGAEALVVKGNESAGFVGEETTFVLLQRILPKTTLPVYARGGIGLRTAAACFAAGVKGIVLDWQVALCEGSALPTDLRARVERMDGGETAIVGQDLNCRYRVWSRPDDPGYAELKATEELLSASGPSSAETIDAWQRAVNASATRGDLLFIGQDACFAVELAEQYRNVGSACNALLREAVRQCRVASHLNSLRENGPLALSHGTKYPIVQGPMTRVSDRADFALAVAEAGALPVLALALMRGPDVRTLLEETQRKLAGKPWGIGILGFVPRELRDEQLREVSKYTPPFAVIAGGRPDQAKSLEKDGTATYLHVPSPELLRSFLQAGARRVVFEGRECGGHVGPRTSFVLWEQMIRVLTEHLRAAGQDARPEEYHVLFAGGIHDQQSAAMVAALAAPLSERGVRIGVLLGTAYLFTEEAVISGAIQPGFQQEAIACSQTILLETGVGHATRCAETAFGSHFTDEKRRLIREGRTKEEIRIALEGLNLGRLRIAAKGIAREDGKGDGSPLYINMDDDAQRREGMYMIGQVASLRNQQTTMGDLHHDVSLSGQRLKSRVESTLTPRVPGRPPAVAVVGISCVFPKAADLGKYWSNIIHKVNAISEVPKGRWDVDLYFDPNRRAKDKVYSRWGGFLDDITFDPVRYGMPPNTVPSIEPMQLLTLEMVARALADAGYQERKFNRERTSVIVGTGGGVGELGLGYGFRSLIPQFIDSAGGTMEDSDSLIEKLEGHLPEWTEDSFAGLLLNVVAGRVANRFDLGGTNYIVDAACATSLAAVRLAVNELQSGSSDVVIAAASDMMQTPFGYLCFSKTQALSPTGQCRTFDESADGIVISEGVCVAVLKRLEDAEREGDNIYAVIRSVGASSDGRDKGLTAPRPIGQIRALERAYELAGVAPSSVGLIEAHGTGTVVGDRTEVESLTTFFRGAGSAIGRCALGSVKSMIGHTKCTAGMAGLVKAALALHNGTLPPTAGITKPNSTANFPATPFYLNTETRPWFASDDSPRRAGVSAFGFGGTNFHVVLEEYVPPEGTAAQANPVAEWPAELFIWRASTAAGLWKEVDQVAAALAGGAQPRLCDLASALAWAQRDRSGAYVLGVVATSLDDLSAKLQIARSSIHAESPIQDPRGVYYSNQAATHGKIAFLFPGQGSQRVNMLGDLAVAFPCVRKTFEEADQVLADAIGKPLTDYIFPPPFFADDAKASAESTLKQTRIAQPALGAAGIAVSRLLGELGLRPDMAGGHSFGELAALCASGALTFADLLKTSEARGRLIEQAAKDEPGAMAAVDADESKILSVLSGISGVEIANLNSPRQTVISGTQAGIAEALARFSAARITAKQIPVACAFHSQLVAGARVPFRDYLEHVAFTKPRFPVYSNTTTAPHAAEPDAIRNTLSDHLVRPVRFSNEVLAMYEAGARVFVEAGPGRVLSGLAAQVLDGRPVHTIAFDQPGRSGLLQLVHALAQLATAGVRFSASAIFEGRVQQSLDLNQLVDQTKPKPLSATTWMITNGRAIPAHQLKEAVADQPAAKTRLLQVSTLVSATPAVPSAPSPAPAAAAMAVAAPSGRVNTVLRSHRQLMERFLDTHRSVMLGLLNGESQPAHDIRQSIPVPARAAAPAPSRETPAPKPQLQAQAVPALTSEPVAPPPPSASAVLTREEVTERLVKLVSHRTGYPPEMLNLDLDMEADLGIDSIKRVEILGELQNAALLSASSLETEIENLSRLKTIGAIVGWIVEHHSGPTRAAALPPASVPETAPVATPAAVPADLTRMLVEAVDAPAVGSRNGLENHGPILIIDDGGGVAPALATRLAEIGLTSNIVEGAGTPEFAERSQEVMALIDLAPLRAALPDTLEGFDTRFESELNTLYRLSREFESKLRSNGHGALLVATRMGGAFGSQEGTVAFWPGSGAVCGFVKAVSREWPEVNCKAVDFDDQLTPSEMADAILTELFTRDHLIEVGYRNGRRVTLASIPSALEHHHTELSLDSNSVIVVTGGARGVTAECATELARRFRPKLVLIGRSPLPGAVESPETAPVQDERELKAKLAHILGADGTKATPAQVEREVKRILRERDMRLYMQAMTSAGASVDYYQADTGDAAAFANVVDQIYQHYGRIDGVIHGAGIIEDKLLRDKTPESFERVLRPKITGALVLARKLRPDSLRFLAFFSSVSARYGNRGQSDYAAANEALNKLAIWLNRQWPARVVSVNWGPWNTARGMVSTELAERFAEAGVQMVSAQAGREAFVNEILYGDSRCAEVVLGGPIPAAAAQRDMPSSWDLPLLSEPLEHLGANGTIKIGVPIDVERHAYLSDHCLDGQPVLPMAMVLELSAEISSRIAEGHQPARVRNLQVLNGITLPNGSRKLRLEAACGPLNLDGSQLVDLSILSAESAQTHYKAHIELGRHLPRAPFAPRLMLQGPQPLPIPLEEAYHLWLFHGPRMAGVVDVEALGDNGIIGTVRPSSPAALLQNSASGAWLIDPIMVDSGLQLLILWARARMDQTPLPSSLGCYHRFGTPSSDAIRCEAEIRRQPGNPTLRVDLRFFEDGRLLGWMEDMRVTCSRELNRLAEKRTMAARG